MISRILTREVTVGDLIIGGENPIRIQSMTTTDTMDIKETVKQCIRLAEVGCEIIRLTAPSIQEAEYLGIIKKELKKHKRYIPLVADIHYTPNAAEVAARLIDKVRINPGNYVDKKIKEGFEYTDKSYTEELERIRERFLPLIKICKEYGTAMRIGTNHGSLSDRILSKYGDTSLGMVESAMEFVRMCEEEKYYNIVLSMKASNPTVMVESYRLLVEQMKINKQNYPLHLGVTEAGDGEDGRIKSAVGIGTLLSEGIGDTIRVSLTEEPEKEIPVAKQLVNLYTTNHFIDIQKYNSPTIQKENATLSILKNYQVVANLSSFEKLTRANFYGIGYLYYRKIDKWRLTDFAADIVYIGTNTLSFELPTSIKIVQDASHWDNVITNSYPLFDTYKSYATQEYPISLVYNFIKITYKDCLDKNYPISSVHSSTIVYILTDKNIELQEKCIYFLHHNVTKPLIITHLNFDSSNELSILLKSASDVGKLLMANGLSGVWLGHGSRKLAFMNNLSFGILQATRNRISKTEYIACPSCGRTLFDLQETTARIRAVTSHLKGLKIGIMGCIVNGPGEMADADFGYVGTGKGKITLYKGREVVKKNIPESEAVEELIALIKDNGAWVENKTLQI